MSITEHAEYNTRIKYGLYNLSIYFENLINLRQSSVLNLSLSWNLFQWNNNLWEFFYVCSLGFQQNRWRVHRESDQPEQGSLNSSWLFWNLDSNGDMFTDAVSTCHLWFLWLFVFTYGMFLLYWPLFSNLIQSSFGALLFSFLEHLAAIKIM